MGGDALIGTQNNLQKKLEPQTEKPAIVSLAESASHRFCDEVRQTLPNEQLTSWAKPVLETLAGASTFLTLGDPFVGITGGALVANACTRQTDRVENTPKSEPGQRPEPTTDRQNPLTPHQEETQRKALDRSFEHRGDHPYYPDQYGPYSRQMRLQNMRLQNMRLHPYG